MIRPSPDHPTEQRHLLTQQAWESGWEGHELAQLRRMAALPLAEKIKWLQEAQEITLRLKAARESQK